MRVTIEKLVYGGSGLARTEQGVVFVPRTAPGDIAEIEVVEKKADYSHGRLVQMLEPSADRQDPYCPNYDSAGCCHWQHIRYPRQLEIKEAIIRETLQRTAKVAWNSPIRIVSGPDRNYRFRATFHVVDGQLGFVQERTNSVVPIQECSALVPELNAFIPTVRVPPGIREVHAIAGDSVVSTLAPAAVPPRITVNGLVFELRPDAFFQSNRFLLADFMNEVLEQSGEKPSHVLDLFCGSGFFALPLARRATEVLGVESNRAAVYQGRDNARLNSIGNVQFFEGQVETMLKDARIHPGLVVLNPPRTGCGKKVAEMIAKMGPGRIVYVSCNPSTFARETGILIASGYTLDRVTMIDQFPNTYHIEMVGEFSNRR